MNDPGLEKQLKHTYEHVRPQTNLQVIFDVHGQLEQLLELTAKLNRGVIAKRLTYILPPTSRHRLANSIA